MTQSSNPETPKEAPKRGYAALWSAQDIALFAVMWPIASRRDLAKAFPTRKPQALRALAHKLKVRRPRNPLSSVLADRENALARDLTKARIAAKQTQEKLGTLLNLDQARVANLERAATGLSVNMLRVWCEALGLELRAVKKRAKREDDPPVRTLRLKMPNVIKFEDFNQEDTERWRKRA